MTRRGLRIVIVAVVAAGSRVMAHTMLEHRMRPTLPSQTRSGVTPLMLSRSPEDRLQTILSNINEGEVGTRGEYWFFGQLGLCGVVLVAPYINITPLTSAFGLLLFLASGVLALGSALALGDSLSPWTKPVVANELKTDGFFSLCRHPIYAGLVGVCAGLSFATVSAERLLVTCVLLAYLNQKAKAEEAQLEELHGESYRAWAATVPRFLPAWSALEKGIDGALDGALSKAGILKADEDD